jgi:hypothetical protein
VAGGKTKRRASIAAAALGLLGLGAAPAFLLSDATASGLPSVSVPSNVVPTVSVPTVTLPAAVPTVPDPTQPVEVPNVSPGGNGGDGPSLTESASGLAGTASGQSSGDSGAFSAGDGSADTSGGSGSAGRTAERDRREDRARARPRVSSFETRPHRFKTRGDDHRGTTLRYRLSRAGLVRFTVFRLAPTCERVGSFVRMGQRGANETPFSGRVKGRPLPAGTYKIVARPVGRGRASTESDRFVVVAPSDSVGSARAAPSACVPGASGSPEDSGGEHGDAVLAGLGTFDGPTDPDKSRPAGHGGDAGEAGGDEGAVAQFRESSPGVLGGSDDVPLPLVLAFCVLLGSLVALLAYFGVRDLTGRLRNLP